jgi:hypothetical protein
LPSAEKTGDRNDLSALEWYQTVYAYGLPPDRRKIFSALASEPSASVVQRDPLEWLLHSFNPHDFAPARRYPFTRFLLASIARALSDFADAEFTKATAESVPLARTLYLTALDLLGLPEMRAEAPSDVNPFPPNPVPDTLRAHAELNLAKLRQGRNIAGMLRQIDASTQHATPVPASIAAGSVTPAETTIRPTPYYFSVLIDRAKHLAGLSQQIEAAYLSALEKFDAESYNLLKARQDLELAGKGIELQTLRVSEAVAATQVAARQQDRAFVQQEQYQKWIDVPVSDTERKLLDSYRNIAGTQTRLAVIDGSLAALQGWSSAAAAMRSGNPLAAFAGFFAFGIGNVINAQKQAETGKLAQSQADAQIFAQQSSMERLNEWRLQKALADQDHAIATQQAAVAEAHEAIANRERELASLQQQHAEAIVTFLASKFTSAELYAWMSGVLGQVYRYFLQQATSVARTAEHQLAFERQQRLGPLVQVDYWQPPSDTGVGSGTPPDRRGLTGSARLLQDIYQLDQFAFETNKRKLHLSQTLSLAQLFPQEFEDFRRTGRLPFATSMSLFDRAFPGHFLRLIRRVRTSVIALIPPTQGIRATLTSDDYRAQVIATLDRGVEAECAFSFRNHFVDAWYNLSNGGPIGGPSVAFTVDRSDFPPHVEDVRLKQLALYFVRPEKESREVKVTSIVPPQAPAVVQPGTTSEAGLISTRRASGTSWQPLLGSEPFGEWKLTLADNPETRDLFSSGNVDDVVLLLTYSGHAPAWV